MSFLNRCSAAPALAAAVAASLALSPIATFAAGTETGSSSADSAPTYSEAKGLVYKKKYTEARALLQEITVAEPTNADAWNLLGFSSRKSGDLKAAAVAYDKALTLNPGHLGALEYQGEMFIQIGDAAKAKANLVKLQGLCGNCKELRDLQKALTEAGLS